MEDRLNNFSKILLATAAINQMAASLNQIIDSSIAIDAINLAGNPEDYPTFNKNVANEGVFMNQKFMGQMVNKLSDVMNEFGEWLDGGDMICEIDQRILKAPFEIIVREMDEVENSYEFKSGKEWGV